MTAGWSVDVIGAADERDSHDVRCSDTTELARVVGVAAALSKARVIRIRRLPIIADNRVTVQLEPDRFDRLIEVLRAAGAHPSGLGSYEAATDAIAFADDLEAQR